MFATTIVLEDPIVSFDLFHGMNTTSKIFTIYINDCWRDTFSFFRWPRGSNGKDSDWFTLGVAVESNDITVTVDHESQNGDGTSILRMVQEENPTKTIVRGSFATTIPAATISAAALSISDKCIQNTAITSVTLVESGNNAACSQVSNLASATPCEAASRTASLWSTTINNNN